MSHKTVLVVSLVVSSLVTTSLHAEKFNKLRIPDLKESANKSKKTDKSTVKVAEPAVTTAVIPEADYEAALKLYNENKFQESYKAFNALFEIKPDDARVNFYLGRSATELKLYDEALLAFERVLAVDPAHARSRMEMARIYMEEKSFDTARAEFEKVLEFNVPKEIKSQVEQYIAIIDSMKQRHFISGAVIVGLSMDTNVKNDVGADSYTIPTLLVSAGSKPVYDYSMSETLAASHKYKLDKSDWNWANSLVLYNQHYRQSVESNVLFSQIGSGFEYNSKAFNFSIIPTIENLKYGLTHTPTDYNGVERITGALSRLLTIDRLTDTMDAIGVGQKFSMPVIDDKTVLDQSLSIKKQFFKTTDGMDAIALDTSLGMKRSLSGGKSIGAGVTLAKNLQVTPGRTDVAYSSQTLKLDYSMPVEKYFDLALNLSVKKTAYEDVDNTFGEKQQDIYKGVGATATKILNPTTILNATIGKAWNTSTLPNKVYQKTTAGISLIKAF